MIILCLFTIPFFYILIKLILCLLVQRFGKFSYDGFSAFGFRYHSQKDIFYSSKNAWQRNFGYTRYYDVWAPIFQIIVDTEPIRFYYNNKNWLITFWKGQYGIVSGAEVGVYCTRQQIVNKKTLYLPVSDDEMLNIYFVLYKKGKVIAKVRAKHWWLTVFKLGMFSKPKELTMDIQITFPDHKMLDSFLASFKKLGYSAKHFTVTDNTFCFRYTKPRTRKVWTRSWISDGIRQFINRKNVELYDKYLSDCIDDNRIDDSKIASDKNVILVEQFLPGFVKNIPENQTSFESKSV